MASIRDRASKYGRPLFGADALRASDNGPRRARVGRVSQRACILEEPADAGLFEQGALVAVLRAGRLVATTVAERVASGVVHLRDGKARAGDELLPPAPPEPPPPAVEPPAPPPAPPEPQPEPPAPPPTEPTPAPAPEEVQGG